MESKLESIPSCLFIDLLFCFVRSGLELKVSIVKRIVVCLPDVIHPSMTEQHGETASFYYQVTCPIFLNDDFSTMMRLLCVYTISDSGPAEKVMQTNLHVMAVNVLA